MTRAGEETRTFDWDTAMYSARSLLGWSLKEFWTATPALLDSQMRCHLKMHRPPKGKKHGAVPVQKVKYIDQLPGNFW